MRNSQPAASPHVKKHNLAESPSRDRDRSRSPSPIGRRASLPMNVTQDTGLHPTCQSLSSRDRKPRLRSRESPHPYRVSTHHSSISATQNSYKTSHILTYYLQSYHSYYFIHPFFHLFSWIANLLCDSYIRHDSYRPSFSYPNIIVLPSLTSYIILPHITHKLPSSNPNPT